MDMYSWLHCGTITHKGSKAHDQHVFFNGKAHERYMDTCSKGLSYPQNEDEDTMNLIKRQVPLHFKKDPRGDGEFPRNIVLK